jgi:hypothetical protein
MRLCRVCALFLASAMARVQETPVHAGSCTPDCDAPSVQGKGAPPICCSQLTLQTQLGGEASTLCTFNASAMTIAHSNRTIREPLTLVYADESQAYGLYQLCSRSPHWSLRCIIFARFREVRWTNFHQSVSAPIHHSVLMVRQAGTDQWEAGPEIGRFPDAGVMMFADELGDFDRSFNTLCAFSLHTYWLDDSEVDGMSVCLLFAASLTFHNSMWNVACGIRNVACGMLHVGCGMLHVELECCMCMWNVACGMLHLGSGTWAVGWM